MLLNRDVCDTSLPQSIINDDRMVLSLLDAVIADVTGAGRIHTSESGGGSGTG